MNRDDSTSPVSRTIVTVAFAVRPHRRLMAAAVLFLPAVFLAVPPASGQFIYQDTVIGASFYPFPPDLIQPVPWLLSNSGQGIGETATDSPSDTRVMTTGWRYTPSVGSQRFAPVLFVLPAPLASPTRYESIRDGVNGSGRGGRLKVNATSDYSLTRAFRYGSGVGNLDFGMPAGVYSSLAGIDARSQATSIADRPFDARGTQDTGEPITRGVDPVQFYAEQYFPRVGEGLDVKAGRFVFQFGAEGADATLNGFVSRAYNFIYSPLTHTGVLTTLRLTDAWSMQEGVVTDTDIFVAPTTDLTYFGSVKWAPPGRNIVLLAYILGNGRFDQKEWPHDPKVFDLTFTHEFSSGFRYTVDALYGFTSDDPNAGFVNWWASVQYLSYVLTPQLTAVGRLEFFDDVQGHLTGFEGLYIVPTVGVNVRPNRFVLIRPEIRFDYNTESRAFDGKYGLATTALGMVARW